MDAQAARITGDSTIIATFIHGNMMGVIEEPVSVKELPTETRKRQWLVKIGCVDPVIAKSAPFPRKDAQNVVSDLRDFLLAEGFAKSLDDEKPHRRSRSAPSNAKRPKRPSQPL